MRKIAVSEIFHQTKYDCPECDWPHWITDLQLKVKRFFIVCSHCGTSFKPELPPHIKVEEKKDTSIYNTDLAKEVIEVVMAQGYSVKEAKERYRESFDPRLDLTELVLKCLAI